MLDFDMVGRALLDAEYRFAKTMPEHPHWYTLRKTWDDHDLFEGVVQFIYDNGYREKFGRAYYKRLDVNGMKYWCMNAPPPKTILINRAEIDRPAVYDDAADAYDDLFATPEADAENREVFGQIGYERGAVLDVGCGTGLLLDYVKPDHYLGIDPSRKMLDVMARRHPEAQTIHTALRSFIPPGDFGFDLVVALFGTASYLSPDELQRAVSMVNPGGRFAFMFYAPGYRPVTHEATGINPGLFDHGAFMTHRADRVERIGNFDLAIGRAEALAA